MVYRGIASVISVSLAVAGLLLLSAGVGFAPHALMCGDVSAPDAELVVAIDGPLVLVCLVGSCVLWKVRHALAAASNS